MNIVTITEEDLTQLVLTQGCLLFKNDKEFVAYLRVLIKTKKIIPNYYTFHDATSKYEFNFVTTAEIYIGNNSAYYTKATILSKSTHYIMSVPVNSSTGKWLLDNVLKVPKHYSATISSKSGIISSIHRECPSRPGPKQ